MWLEQLTVENLIGENSNMIFFGEQLKELERVKKAEVKIEKLKMSSQKFRCQNNVINCKVEPERISDKNIENPFDKSGENQSKKFLQHEGEHVGPLKPEILTKYLTKKNKKYIQSEKKEHYIQDHNQQEKWIRDRYIIEENKKSEEEKKT